MRFYINKEERDEANRQLPRLLGEGLLLGGTGLGVLALIFEIAADAFSVAAYQTLLAIHGADGHHDVAMLAFAALSVMLFLGVVPAYKGAAYLSPNTGGSGPLVEAIGPQWLRKASWIGTSLFFLDAILTIIISSISAADVTMLLTPEWAPYRILLAELYAFFIMGVLVALGPKRAVPLFLLGGGAFTIFTIFALGYVGIQAGIDPGLADKTHAIVERLEQDQVVLHVIQNDGKAIGMVLFFQLFLRSMSSAMLGFSGYEVIPASGKHAARPKWKVINTALTLAAIFLIGTGILQLFAASQWAIPSTEGYSTLLIEYEIVFGNGSTLIVAGVLLAIILLLAQGGGYVGGAAVAANASRLGRLPKFFSDDRIGIAVIWGISAIMIPIIREVVVVEAYYAFGFVSAFVITSTTLYFVRDDVIENRGIEPGSPEARSLKFAGLRGMVASYIMLIVLVTQKTNALVLIGVAGASITALQFYIAWGSAKQPPEEDYLGIDIKPGTPPSYSTGLQRAHDEARQRGIVDQVNALFEEGLLVKFNVEPPRIRRLISYTHNILTEAWDHVGDHHDEHDEPSLDLQMTYDKAFRCRSEILKTIERYSHYGIFTFIEKYYHNWLSEHRDKAIIEKTMIKALFPLTPLEEVWEELRAYEWLTQPEEVWQFCRERYQWAKDQWPNLSDRITTVWTLQDLGMLKEEDNERIMKVIDQFIPKNG